MTTTVRNVLIILVGAAAIAFLPSGGDVANVAWRAVSLAFLAVIAFGMVWAYRSYRVEVASLDNGMRVALYAGVAGLALAAAGYRWLTLTSGRSFIFMAIVAASVGALLVVWQRSRDLS